MNATSYVLLAFCATAKLGAAPASSCSGVGVLTAAAAAVTVAVTVLVAAAGDGATGGGDSGDFNMGIESSFCGDVTDIVSLFR